MVRKKILNRDNDFYPKLIGVPKGGKSDYKEGTGVYDLRNKKALEEFQKFSMTKTLVLIRNGEYSITCDFTKPAIGLTFHDYAGNRLMDFNAHVGVEVLGYNHPRVVEVQKAIANLMIKQGLTSIGAGTDFPILSEVLPDARDLNKLLVDTARKNGFWKIAKAGGWSTGTEAVENCMKVAYDWKKRTLFEKWGKHAEDNWRVLEDMLGYPLFGIAADKSFHGRTFGALSMTHSKPVQYAYFPKIPNIKHIPYISKDSKEKFTIEDVVSIESFDKLFKDGTMPKVLGEGKVPAELLAFICLEPVQGEGGYKIGDKSFIKETVDFCQANDVVYIDDEVQTGMGRSGKFFCLNHFIDGGHNITIPMAKGLQVSAVLVEEAMNYDQQGRASTTTGYGRVEDIARGYTMVEAILEGDGALMKNATEMGDYFNKELKKINNGAMTRVDNLGLLVVTDFETPDIRNKVFEGLVEKGVVPLTVGTNGIRWLPPLDVRKQELDYAVKTLEQVLKTL